MYSVEIKGKNAPLLMLHGWGQSHEALMPLAALLSDQVTPYLIDLPGFGKSERPMSCWSAYDYADALVHYLDTRGIDKISLLGHSFGGKVALCLAIRHPERVDKLILIAPSGIPQRRAFLSKVKFFCIRAVGKSMKMVDRIFGTRYFTRVFAPRFASRDYKNAGDMRSILVKSVNEDLSSEIPKIQCETLLLWGEKDQETPLEAGKRLSGLIPRSTFHSFPHHDHQLFHDVGAHLCAKYIKAFI